MFINKRQSDFARVLFSRNFAYAKFRKNKTLAKIFKFTVIQQIKRYPFTTASKSMFSKVAYVRITKTQRKSNEVAFFIGKIEIFIFYKMSDAIKEC